MEEVIDVSEELVEDSQQKLPNISSGVAYLVDGYIAYSEEVISNRALPHIYDGLKPVNRRILQIMHTEKIERFTKSNTVAGFVMGKLHPHGDAAIYAAMVLMTDSNGSLAYPPISGHGSFSHVYSSDKPAASRYTEVKLHSCSKEYFSEMDGITMVPNFDSTCLEPEILPVSFPAVLVNSTSGIAVGFKCNIPSFNFNDVLDLVTEYINDGACHTVIEPDFVTGGYYVKNDKELMKLMKAGKARLKLRGKTITDGKYIHVTQVPFSKTSERLVSQINALDSTAIVNAIDGDDYTHESMLIVNCSSKSRVDEALYTIYKSTDFQFEFSADITVIDDGVPVRLGVWEIIERWVKRRRAIYTKAFSERIADYKQSMREALAFMEIINDKDKKMKIVEIIASEGRNAGKKFIEENFTREQIPADLIDFCGSRSLPNYYDGGKYASEYSRLQVKLKELETSIGNVDAVILKDMVRLKAEYGHLMPRMTEVTTKDYIFTENNDVQDKIVDTSDCVYEFKSTGFLKKLRVATNDTDVLFRFDGKANDTLIAFDNRGRLIRVYCSDISLNSASDIGTYLPVYLNLNESDDYRITWIGVLDGSELMLLYKDGNVGFVDTSEWNDSTRNVKVLNRGISPSAADLLGAVLKNIPDMLFVTDEDGRIAYTLTDRIKHKDRTAKTRVFDLVNGCQLDSYVGMPRETGAIYLNNISQYSQKLRYLFSENDFRGSGEDFVAMM